MSKVNGRVLQIQGPEGLAEACHEVLVDPNIDMGICIGATSQLGGFRDGRQAGRGRAAANIDLLYDRIPQLHDVDAVVAEWWEHEGFSDYDLVPKMPSGAMRTGGVFNHCDADDTPDNPDGSLSTGMTFSLGLGRLARGRFQAEKPDILTRAPDGTYDRDIMWAVFREARARKYLRSSARQDPGDLVFIAEHPVPTMHGVLLPALLMRKAVVFGHRAMPKHQND